MKIVMVHNTYRQAGGEDVVFENERRLLERGGHRVVSFLRSNIEMQDASVPDRILITPRMLWSFRTRRELGALLDAERPDLVHVHNTFLAISPSIYSACSERGIPVVQTLHNFRLLCPSANLFRKGQVCEECVEHNLLRSVRHGCYRDSRPATAAVALMLAFHRALDTWSESVTRFIALTEFAKQKFVAAGFPAAEIVVKPNFVDPDPCQRKVAGEYALFVGRLTDDKGLRVLLDAWKQLPEPYPLQIVGGGRDLVELREEARHLRISTITFRGALPRDLAIEAMKQARFLIVPSTWYEAFPMCIVEAFACGVPVLCSRLGSLAEIIEDHETGLHFKPGDPKDLARVVEWAWRHPLELSRLGRAARQKYETDYTAEKNYSQLMKIYAQVLSDRRPMDSPEPVAPRLVETAGRATAASEIPPTL